MCFVDKQADLLMSLQDQISLSNNICFEGDFCVCVCVLNICFSDLFDILIVFLATFSQSECTVFSYIG